MKETLRKSSQIFGNSSPWSKSQRRGDEKEETLIGGGSMTAGHPAKFTVLSLRSSFCLFVFALPVGSIWETQEGKRTNRQAGIKIQSYSMSLLPKVCSSLKIMWKNIELVFFTRDTRARAVCSLSSAVSQMKHAVLRLLAEGKERQALPSRSQEFLRAPKTESF